MSERPIYGKEEVKRKQGKKSSLKCRLLRDTASHKNQEEAQLNSKVVTEKRRKKKVEVEFLFQDY